MHRPSRRVWELVTGKIAIPNVSKSHNGEMAVCTSYFNPCGYKNRYNCWCKFRDGVLRQGADLWVIEIAYGGDWVIQEDSTFKLVRVRADDRIWQKERALNVLIDSLPHSYTKVVWVDCDVLFDNDNWVEETRKVLDVYSVVQPFESAVWLGPDGQPCLWGYVPCISMKSIAFAVWEAKESGLLGLVENHPGFVWGARREVIQQLGGLYDKHILGGGDAVMTFGFLGLFDLHKGFFNSHNPIMKSSCYSWAYRAYDLVCGNVAYVPGVVRHLYHGSYSNRMYDLEFRLNLMGDFDPDRHLEFNDHRLWKWSSYAPSELIGNLYNYFNWRREDEG